MCTVGYTNHKYTSHFSIDTLLTVLLCGTALGTSNTRQSPLWYDTSLRHLGTSSLLVRTSEVFPLICPNSVY